MPPDSESNGRHITTLNEKPLHAALKEWYAEPGDRVEVAVDGFFIDLVRKDLLIEIQTANFTSIRRKLRALTQEHQVHLVHPIPREKWIVRLDADGVTPIGRRKSPKRGAFFHVFDELVRIPTLMGEPNFSLEVLLTQEEELRYHDPGRAWRRKGWVIAERRLLEVVDRRRFDTPHDLLGFLPEELEEPFTTADLGAAAQQPVWLARKAAYCLREMGAIEVVGKKGNAFLYVRHASQKAPCKKAPCKKASRKKASRKKAPQRKARKPKGT